MHNASLASFGFILFQFQFNMGSILLLQFVVLALLLSFHSSFHSVVSTPSNTDKEALLSLKSQISTDPSYSLSTWHKESNHCNWTGVFCDRYRQRVISLDLSGLGLTGTISPHIGNLSSLSSINFQENQLSGTIPDQIGDLPDLRVLNFSYNLIVGSIPQNISLCSELRILDLMRNEITGSIPEELGYLSNIEILRLGRNRLSGLIPPSFSNLSSLIILSLGTNFLGGTISSDLGRLHNLEQLDLTINGLTGTVPPSIYNISSLVHFGLASNQLWGQIPSDVGDKLPNLLDFNICINKFTGTIPLSLHNLTHIHNIRMKDNLLVGSVPPGLENLPELRMYVIGFNRIQSSGERGLSFITSLTNCTRLNFLAIEGNLLEGVIPESIGNLSADLTHIYMGGNHISGYIPPSIGRLRSLALLNLSYNVISGEIPWEIGQLGELRVLNLASNWISGRIPTSFNFKNMLSVDLSNNRLSGTIPKEILSLTSLSTGLNLSKNLLSGPLLQEIGMLESVLTIDLSSNFLSGRIPNSVGNCKSVENLFLANNLFTGTIPESIGGLKGLETLDLSSNELSGSIPNTLQNLRVLQFLNLSFNRLEGKVPSGGIFRNLSGVNLVGNSNLCLNLTCEDNPGHRNNFVALHIVIMTITPVIAICIFISLVLGVRKRKAKITPTSESMKVGHRMISYDELRLATENFKQENLIGNGGFGSVYKGYLCEKIAIAVKVLDMTRNEYCKSFSAECVALRNVKHRNIVKLITSCSSLDYKNFEFLALVYEFMTNGSLEDWIKGKRRHDNGERLNFVERLNVVIDIGSALVYLHHECEVQVVHCDLKPSNVLLDEDMTAKIADFGLSKLLIQRENDQDSLNFTFGIRGSIGYIPPEYGQGGKPSTSGDVYSYGVLLLELFTGKSPSCEEFTGTSLIEWVQSNFLTNIVELLDPKLLPTVDDDLSYENQFIGQEGPVQSFTTVMEIGLSCTVNSPGGRIGMRDALQKLKNARETLLDVR